jgi:hypothetical protein
MWLVVIAPVGEQGSQEKDRRSVQPLARLHKKKNPATRGDMCVNVFCRWCYHHRIALISGVRTRPATPKEIRMMAIPAQNLSHGDE